MDTGIYHPSSDPKGWDILLSTRVILTGLKKGYITNTKLNGIVQAAQTDSSERNKEISKVEC